MHLYGYPHPTLLSKGLSGKGRLWKLAKKTPLPCVGSNRRGVTNTGHAFVTSNVLLQSTAWGHQDRPKAYSRAFVAAMGGEIVCAHRTPTLVWP